MIGENPDNFANWIAAQCERVRESVSLEGSRILRKISLYWPTELEPPKTTMGCPLYCPFPFSQGAASFLEPGLFLSAYRPEAAVASPSGMDAADSNDTLGGNYNRIIETIASIEPC